MSAIPVVSRLRLRQQVGLTRLRDAIVATTTFSPNLGVGSAVVAMAVRHANTALGSHGLYVASPMRISGIDYHVASFNSASGAYVSAQTAATIVGSGASFEIHMKAAGDDKDRAIDGIIGRLWSRQEVPIDVTDGRLEYSIGAGFKVFGAYWFANPTGSLNRDKRELPIGWNIALTATGREIRLPAGAPLGSGHQLVLDAQVRATLGAADAATINIPDEDWVLNGIAARCYQTLIADAPGKEAGKYRDLAQAYAREFRNGIGRHRDQIDTDWRPAFGTWIGDGGSVRGV